MLLYVTKPRIGSQSNSSRVQATGRLAKPLGIATSLLILLLIESRNERINIATILSNSGLNTLLILRLPRYLAVDRKMLSELLDGVPLRLLQIMLVFEPPC